MHMQGEPRTMQLAPSTPTSSPRCTPSSTSAWRPAARPASPPTRLLIDPGFGFGKTVEHNLTLLRHLSELARDGLPVLVGLSRKSMLGTLTGRAAAERVHGSLALAVIAALSAARVSSARTMWRATVDALKVVAALERRG